MKQAFAQAEQEFKDGKLGGGLFEYQGEEPPPVPAKPLPPPKPTQMPTPPPPAPPKPSMDVPSTFEDDINDALRDEMR